MSPDDLAELAKKLCFKTTLFEYDRRNPYNCVHEIELDEADSDPEAVEAYRNLSHQEQETIEDWAREELGNPK